MVGTIIIARSILALSPLWNAQSITAFSLQGNLCRRATITIGKKVDFLRGNSHIIQAMSSTSSSSLPDGPTSIGKATTIRHRSRKRGVKPASTSQSNNTVDNSMEMLERWIEHDDHSYHLDFLSPPQAYKIRIALVEWYRENRRQLPWRGDGGPYDGSTVGFAASAAAGGKAKGKKRKDEGNDIRSFFGSSSSKKKNKQSAGDEKESITEGEGLADAPREVTAYGVWVSEIMLQQTRVEAVIPYWIKWMKSFPTVHDLANATDEEVNSHWAGLGFYRRARYLHAGAKRVVNDYNGVVPNTVEELLKVEGIGRYTASAVASIAHSVEVPVVDGNVCRVLSRLTGIANHIKAPVLKDDLGWSLAERIVHAKSCSGDGKVENIGYEIIGSPGEVNQALMELGATYCSPAGSGIDDGDPLKEFYVSTQLGMAIGQAAYNSSASGRVESLIGRKSLAPTEKGNQCRLCSPSGVSTAYYNIMARMTADLSTDSKTKPKAVYAIAGHASLPIPPPKKSKREEVIAVAVISSQVSGKERRWLMVKRPSTGLLAGQWEFPSVCVWNSAKDGEKTNGKGKKTTVEVPLIDPTVRSDALDSCLSDLISSSDLPSVDLNQRSHLIDVPIVHIFSHVVWHMWVEHGELDTDEEELIQSKRCKLNNGQEAGWMTECDMSSVGITSGVRKVLAAVQQSQQSAA